MNILNLTRETVCKMLLRNFIIFNILMFLGGLVFMYLEGEEAKKAFSLNAELSFLKGELREALNISKTRVDQLFANLETSIKQNGGKEPYSWDYYESCFFVGSLITTIGYGHIAPKTQAGQIFAIILSLIGIPLNTLVLRNLSSRITNYVTETIEFLFRVTNKTQGAGILKSRRQSIGLSPKLRIRPRKGRKTPRLIASDALPYSDTKAELARIAILIVLVMVYIIISALFRKISEGWDMHHSIYFWFITLTTIGFGDYVPYEGRRPKSTQTTIMYYSGTIYLLIGLSLIASLVHCITGLLEGRMSTTVSPDGSRHSVRLAEDITAHNSYDLKFTSGDGSETKVSVSKGGSISKAIVRRTEPFVGLFINGIQASCVEQDKP